MITAELDVDYRPGIPLEAVRGYSRGVEEETGALAARVMADGMKSVGPNGPSSPPGGFPYSRSGALRNSIRSASDGESTVVGPEPLSPPSNYSYEGASTIAEALNRGATVRVRERSYRRDRRGRFRTRRFQIKPRPFVELTLQIVARRMAAIAQRIPLK